MTASEQTRVRRMIERSLAMCRGRYPISFWNYASLDEHGDHFDEAAVAEWADGGFTVPQSPAYDPKNAAPKHQIQRLLDWAGEYDLALMLRDPRTHGRTLQPGETRDDMLTVYDATVVRRSRISGITPRTSVSSWAMSRTRRPKRASSPAVGGTRSSRLT